MEGVFEDDKSVVKMRVLITYTTDGQIAIIKGLAQSLLEGGIDVLVWNRTTNKCFSSNDELFKDNLSFFNNVRRIPRHVLRVLYHLPCFLTLLVNKGLYRIDVFNFHFHEGLCDRMIPHLKRRNISLIISIWGSDLYRISEKIRAKRQSVYKNVDLIHVESPGVRKDFLAKYDIDPSKVVNCNFGVELFNDIDVYRGNKELIKKQLLPEDASDRIIITCGYNARKGQQHSVIIQQLKELPTEYKKRVFVVFPLTYTVSYDSFLDEIDDCLKDLDIPFCCFKSQLSIDDLAKLRILSDVVINIQVTDALSSSLIEYFYAANIMLLGDWLPYQFLKEDYGMRYIPITCSTITDAICQTIDNIEDERIAAIANVKKTHKLASWDEVAPRFVEMFNSVNRK